MKEIDKFHDPFEVLLVTRPQLFFGGDPTVQAFQGYIMGVSASAGMSQTEKEVLQVLPLYLRIKLFGYNKNAPWVEAILNQSSTHLEALKTIYTHIQSLREEIEEFGMEAVTNKYDNQRTTPNQAL